MDFIELEKSNFSSLLQQIPDCPQKLYCRGNLKLLKEKHLVAIVGSRRATSYGLLQTKKLAFELARAGVVIVSGLALGIDGVAHRGALEAKGKTIAVLGTPISQLYPATNEALGRDIIKNGGLVVSEYSPEDPVFASNFARRNRIIAGLSQVVLVTEAAQKSGALITADLALQYNREVMALPGDVTRINSFGPNNLIKNGASPVLDSTDILEALGLEDGGQLKLDLEIGESEVLKIICEGIGDFDAILLKSKKKTHELSSLLLQLEIKGLIKNAKGKYLFVK